VLVVAVPDEHVERGDILAADFGDAYDPFERLDDRGLDRRRRRVDTAAETSSGLLLAEEFARIDVTRPRQLRSWLLARGALNRLEFYGDVRAEQEAPFPPTVEGWEAQDSGRGIELEQEHVRRELDWLVELSKCRPSTGEAWTVKNVPSWHAALAEAQDRLMFRAERAVRSATRLVPFIDEDGRETIGHDQGEGRRLSWREQREWRSVLAPVSLQLFESWRRISEGLPGAARCRECGQPFLILDGRRTTFCTNRERNRYDQRKRRSDFEGSRVLAR
jgi:hypothetical protein